jgi:hypothetical protein
MFEAKCNIVCVILNLESAHHAKDLMKDKEEQQYFFFKFRKVRRLLKKLQSFVYRC